MSELLKTILYRKRDCVRQSDVKLKIKNKINELDIRWIETTSFSKIKTSLTIIKKKRKQRRFNQCNI